MDKDRSGGIKIDLGPGYGTPVNGRPWMKENEADSDTEERPGLDPVERPTGSVTASDSPHNHHL